MADDASFGPSLLTSFKSVVTICIIICMGIGLVKFKIIDRKGVGVIAQTMNALFLPCMYLDILGSQLSVEKMRSCWHLIVGGFVLSLSGFGFGCFAAQFARPQPFFRKW
jgi:predicted permease